MTAESHNTNEMYLKMKRVSLSAPYIDLDALKVQSSQLLSKTASYLNNSTDHYQTQLQQRRTRLDALNETNKAKREEISKRRVESEHYDSVWKKIQAMEQQIKVTEVKLATLQQKQNLRKQMALHSQKSALYHALASAQLRQNLAVCEKLTGMTVHAIEDNHLKVDFTLIDEREPDKVFSFVVHLLEEHGYKVVQCDPMIPDLPELTESLNRHGDFSSFIKRIRKEFCNLALSSSPPSPQTPPDLTTLPHPINT
ncbi:hypothetical protein [Absidia glauca]|uniref:Kinetochore protein SPC25 n=1 Tax=Absidia glauca TaxID=4829 RepID=A0A163JY58_ABSGL|nr:hypothetical protein [Absidia glauca]